MSRDTCLFAALIGVLIIIGVIVYLAAMHPDQATAILGVAITLAGQVGYAIKKLSGGNPE